MFEGLTHRYRAARRRLGQFERREARAVRRWLEDTENVLHLSAFVLIPALIGLVTWLSNVTPVVSFLLYPPLASGTYTMFADPSGRYADPWRFVAGITSGALCGLIALEASARFWYAVPPAQFRVHAAAATVGIFLTSLVTYALDVEVPTAYSASLLVLVTGSNQLTYVLGIAVSSLLVAGVFSLWRDHFYRNRAQYLFQSTTSDDQVLVPVADDDTDQTSRAAFAGRIADAHDDGSVVLLATVDPEDIESARSDLEATDAAGDVDPDDARLREAQRHAAEDLVTDAVLARLERLRDEVTSVASVPCEFVVAVEDGTRAETVIRAATDENCDLIVAPYVRDGDEPSAYSRRLLTGPVDTIAFQPSNGRTEWSRILVMVRASGEVANTMLDFAARLLPDGGELSACTCIGDASERRSAERHLESVVEAFSTAAETLIAHGPPARVLEREASAYDLAVIGASSDRSIASRALTVPTYERVQDLECDLAIVHRA